MVPIIMRGMVKIKPAHFRYRPSASASRISDLPVVIECADEPALSEFGRALGDVNSSFPAWPWLICNSSRGSNGLQLVLDTIKMQWPDGRKSLLARELRRD